MRRAKQPNLSPLLYLHFRFWHLADMDRLTNVRFAPQAAVRQRYVLGESREKVL
jgi:hypothetical protein